jgi:hypothetical protein
MDAKKKKHDMKGPFSIFNCFGMVNLLLLPSDLKKKKQPWTWECFCLLSWFSSNSHVISWVK